jgi:hypothetical protein
MRFMTGAPSAITMLDNGLTGMEHYEKVCHCLDKKHMVGTDTPYSSRYGLVAAHAYSVVGHYKIKDASGKVVANLLRIMNPWNKDKYTGPWSDQSDLWTDEYKAQVPFTNDNMDGAFYIDIDSWVYGFNYYTITYVDESWKHSYYEVYND